MNQQSGAAPKRIVILDSKRAVSDLLRLALIAEKGHAVVAQSECGLGAVELCRIHQPDLLVLDLVFPELRAWEVIRRLHEAAPATRTLIFADCASADLVTEALRAEPSGFVERTESLSALLEAIETVTAGQGYFSAFPTEQLAALRRGEITLISAREREIVQMIAEGGTSKEIGYRLGISPKTVENHRCRVMQRLRLRSVADVTRYAIRCGWVSAE